MPLSYRAGTRRTERRLSAGENFARTCLAPFAPLRWRLRRHSVLQGFRQQLNLVRHLSIRDGSAFIGHRNRGVLGGFDEGRAFSRSSNALQPSSTATTVRMRIAGGWADLPLRVVVRGAKHERAIVEAQLTPLLGAKRADKRDSQSATGNDRNGVSAIPVSCYLSPCCAAWCFAASSAWWMAWRWCP
jgi:hypothetical protein